MKITKELESRFLILFSVLSQNGKATKNEVLDYLESNKYVILSPPDMEKLATRNEVKWRNTFAFVRSHLVKEGYLNNKEKNYWEITDEGKDYFLGLQRKITSGNTQKISPLALKTIDEVSDRDLIKSQLAKELIEDNKEIENETISRIIEQIKRYQSIIANIKNKYKSKCQILSCQFTFKKCDGSSYSEGHHLIPISQNGSQDESNLVILCANHHRMFHFANIQILDRVNNEQTVIVNGEILNIQYK